MKIAILPAMMMSVLALTACGENHEHVHAVDRVEQAAERAAAKAPEPAVVKFDDEGQKTAAPAATTDSTATPATETATPAEGEKPAEAAATDTKAASDAGQKLYDATCKTCHDSGLAGAPKMGDKAAWQPRIAKGKDTLHNNAINGFNAMPAKGGSTAPDDEVKAAVDYMISKSS